MDLRRTATSSLALLVLALAACGSSGVIEGGDPIDDDETPSCEQVAPIEFTPSLPPDLLLVVDKSGSMKDDLATGATKWPVMRDALKATVTGHDDAINFGLMLYPYASKCGAGRVELSIAADNAAGIADELDGVAPDGATPTHASLAAARAYFASHTAAPGAARYVLLATDGIPNCAPDDDDEGVEESVAAIAALKSDGIETYVLGFGGSENVDPGTLASMAAAGGTGSAYAANSPAQLADALADITAAVDVPSCTFALDRTVTDAAELTVYADGDAIALDPAEGFSYDAGDNAITMHGAACEAIQRGDTTQVRLDYGCGAGSID